MLKHKSALRESIRDQIVRFEAFRGCPTDERQFTALVEELISAFADLCDSRSEVERLGNQIMRSARFFPVPADVYAAHKAYLDSLQGFVGEWRGNG